MLLELLAIIKRGSAIDIGNLSNQLGVTRVQVLVMLEDLERMGRIKKVNFCETSGCSTCSLAAKCNSTNQRVISWVYQQE